METGLQLVSEAHGHLQGIMQAVRRLYMRAVNAMLNARGLGSEAAGYQAVTLELRRFSKHIDGSSDELRGRIRELVYYGAARQRQARRLVRLEKGLDEAVATVASAAEHRLEDLRASLGRQDREIARLAKEIKRISVRVLRLVESGRNLGLMLRTEAAASSALTDGIGDEINTLMDCVAEELDSIERRMDQLNETRE